jgi:hypothetical protein
MEPQSQPLLPPEPKKISVLNFVKKAVIAVLLIVVGFVLGTYAAMLSERRVEQRTVSTFPTTYYGVSTVAYATGTALYALNPGTQCGDHPRYPCEGSLYEIKEGQLKQVASNVIGHQVIYYEPGVRALLQSGWGDGSCREAKFYLYDFATASSSLSFAADNDCDGFEERNNEYQKAISDYLIQFGL